MPDWVHLRAAFRAGLPNALRLQTLHRLENLLDLPPDQAKAALRSEATSAPVPDVYGNLVILNFAIQRDLGIVQSPDLNAQLQRLFDEVQQGKASATRTQSAKRLSMLWDAAGELIQKDQSLTVGPTAAEVEKTKFMQQALPVFAQLQEVEARVGPGTVSRESLDRLESLLEQAKALLSSADPTNEGLSYVLYMTGSAARMLAGCYALVGRYQHALALYADAADYFGQAKEPVQVSDCRDRASDLERRLSGDLDAVAEAALKRLNFVAEQEDPWLRVKSFMQLADAASSAGDTFESQQNARTAAGLLQGLGYLNPLQCDWDEALESWIREGTQTLAGVPLLGRLSQIETWFDSIAGAEFAVAVTKDKAEADRIRAIQNDLHKVSARFAQEAKAAEAEHAADMARYFPDPFEKKAAPEQQRNRDDFQSFLDKCIAIDDSLARIRESCNQRAGSGDGMQDLLLQLNVLREAADQLNSPEYEAKTRLEEVYVLGHLGRATEMIPVAQEARRRLLSGRPDSLGSFSQSHQRYLYLDSRLRELQARIMSGDLEGGLDLAESTIRDFERERYRVQNEFRQAALLSYVAEFYKAAALAAFKAAKWDNMLAAIDLIKARSAVRNAILSRDTELTDSDIARRFEQISDDLISSVGSKKRELEEERRRLWDLLSVSQDQGTATAEIPSLTVTSLQGVLTRDEVVISYFWLNEAVLLTVVVGSAYFHAERIVLKPPELQRLKGFISCVQTLKGPQLGMDKEIAKLGQILLPEFVRAPMRGKRRVFFSPHHSLHLFPFHATPWDEGFIGTEFAVSYVPNLSSLLLSWAKRSENRILAIGINQFTDPTVPALRSVEADVQTICSFYERTGAAVQMLLGAEATRARLDALRKSGELSKFRCIHLGTHGRSVFEVPDQPLESSLELQNGRLDGMEIGNLRLHADLVVLSACNSGQRAIQLRNLGEAPGDDIFGLQAALFKAGARSIFGTLWIVQVESASHITRNFHQHYAEGEPADIALQQSVKAYLEDATRPHQAFYWAPFFITSLGTTKQGGQIGDRTTHVPL